jgi:hypothetical protein
MVCGYALDDVKVTLALFSAVSYCICLMCLMTMMAVNSKIAVYLYCAFYVAAIVGLVLLAHLFDK